MKTLATEPNRWLLAGLLLAGLGANTPATGAEFKEELHQTYPKKKNWPIGHEARTRLGEGGTKIRLSSVNGGLRIHLAKPAEKKTGVL